MFSLKDSELILIDNYNLARHITTTLNIGPAGLKVTYIKTTIVRTKILRTNNSCCHLSLYLFKLSNEQLHSHIG